ncbi:MAG: ABC transporter ATP-binding protein, partial [Cyclobacteriaceae bacterium]|nr:ABC transporter ATP-binding protein [Cyclobacteriaceae bacterium]
ANKIWYIDNQLIKEYPGTYVEYEIWRKKNQPSEQTSQDQKSDSTLKKNKNKTNSSELKISNQISKLKKKLESVENEIEINEREISRIEEEMSDVEIYSNPDKLVEVNKRYENLKRILEDKNTRWEQIAEEIEELE